ncbi:MULTISPECIES: dihydrofolate reductase [Rhodomicrobium]|uniref:dihydrofolate reductase n=1 Tax=Rhodomicrobium TaxID=1068 RepID=UPI001FD8B45B|nr:MULTISPECIES: dihydrofolate reductase [Rhodomicrobium]
MSAMDPIVAFVVAIGENGVIGRAGGLPWHLPSEMAHFRSITMNKPVIMGRKTFSSLKKPLQKRDNIVLTHNRDFAPRGAIAVESVDQALRVARDCALARAAKEVMVIGGAEIYAALMAEAKRIYLTRVHAAPDGDVRFPEIDLNGWRETASKRHSRSGEDEFDYTISVWERPETNGAA